MASLCYCPAPSLADKGRYSIARVKFGFPLDQVCKNNIPGPLLVLILKLNKEAPYRKDVFRAPGHQSNIKQLVHFLQNGRLVNLDNFSLYTIASVLKKFLRKIPDGIFGIENEQRLFEIIEMEDPEVQRQNVLRLIQALPPYTQQLLVLLFGTFRVIATQAERARTGMTSEALGVSAAPSFFRSCVTGREARHGDVLRFKVAMRVMKFLIDNFGVSDLFGRENYEYYARITGRVLRVERDWIFSFRYPPDSGAPLPRSRAGRDRCACSAPASGSPAAGTAAGQQRVTSEMRAAGTRPNLQVLSSSRFASPSRLVSSTLSAQCRSTPARLHLQEPIDGSTCGEEETAVTETGLGASCPRLSASLESGVYQMGDMSRLSGSQALSISPEELKCINQHASSTRCLTQLPLVHERQTERMRTRSEWFLSPQRLPRQTGAGSDTAAPSVAEGSPLARAALLSSAGGGSERRLVRRSSSRDKERRQLLRRSASIEQRLVRRNSSREERRPLRRAVSRDRLDRRPPRRVASKRGDKENVSLPPAALRRSMEELHMAGVYKPRL